MADEGMDFIRSMSIATSGLRAQAGRMRVISENIANADSLPEKPGETPYRRKIVNFKNELDRSLGLDIVKVDHIRPDRSEFEKKFNPEHPAADDDGYVLTPNVNTLVEMMDMREAQRSYEANLNIISATRRMIQRTLDILKA